jgi:PAS domain-containing protein
MSSRTSRSDKHPHEQVTVDYGRLFRDLPEPYILFEASEPYTVIDVNKAREKLAGGSRAECIGRSLFDMYPYTDKHFRSTIGRDLREHFRQIVRTGRSY